MEGLESTHCCRQGQNKRLSPSYTFVRAKNCCLCCLVLVYFCFVSWFLLVSVFVRAISFCKKNTLAYNCPDNFRAVLNSLFFLSKDFARTKSIKSTKNPKTQPNKSTKRYKQTVGYDGPTKPVIVLPYIRTKTSFLGPFKKLNCLDDLIYITTSSIGKTDHNFSFIEFDQKKQIL